MLIYKTDIILTRGAQEISVYPGATGAYIRVIYSKTSNRNIGPFQIPADELRQLIIRRMIDNPNGAFDLDQYAGEK